MGSPMGSADGDTVQAALRAALRDVVGPSARAHGFTGSAPNWRTSNALGDWAVVNVQSSAYNTRQSLRCVVNLSLAPDPFIAWTARGHARPKVPGEGYGLFRQRLHPAGTPAGVDGWWQVNHPDEAAVAAADIRTQLEVDGWPVLRRLLDRDQLMAQVRAGDLGHMKRKPVDVFFARAAALLLSDAGPSAELDEQLAHALEHTPDKHREHAESFDAWVRRRAAGLDR
jgi:hypothetical protein